MLIKMCKDNSYAKMEKLGAQICRCTRQDLKVMPWQADTDGSELPVIGVDTNIKATDVADATMVAMAVPIIICRRH